MAQIDILMSSIETYLDSQNWHYEKDESRHLFKFGMNLKGQLSSCRVLVQAQNDCIQAFAISPMNVQEQYRPVVAEYITRANYGLKVGKFEMDYSDGEVRYQTILVCSEGVPPQKDVERVVDLSFVMMDRYGKGLVKAMMGFGDPKADIEEIEGKRP